MKPDTDMPLFAGAAAPGERRRGTSFRAVLVESMLVFLVLALFEYFLSDLQRWAQSSGPTARAWLDALAWGPFYYLQVRFIMWTSPKD